MPEEKRRESQEAREMKDDMKWEGRYRSGTERESGRQTSFPVVSYMTPTILQAHAIVVSAAIKDLM